MKIIGIILEEIKKFGTYYRAVGKYLGDEIIFNPEGYYEGVDDNNQPKYKYDTFWISDIKETAASKYIGGAVLGASSMFRSSGAALSNSKLYIYAINEKPDKDISHWGLQDFEFLQEVRYRKPVRGIYVGSVTVTDEMAKLFDLFYKTISNQSDYDDSEEYDEIDNFYNNMIENRGFQKYLNNIKVGSLNETKFTTVSPEVFNVIKSRRFSDADNHNHIRVFTGKDGKEYLIQKTINQDIFRIFELPIMKEVGVAVFDVQNDYFSGYEVNQSINIKSEYRRIGLATALIDFAQEYYKKPYKPSTLLSADMQGFVNNRFK